MHQYLLFCVPMTADMLHSKTETAIKWQEQENRQALA